MNDAALNASLAAAGKRTDLDELILDAERAVIDREARIQRNIGEAGRQARSTGGSLVAATGVVMLLSSLLGRRRVDAAPPRGPQLLGEIALVLPLVNLLLPSIERALARQYPVRRRTGPPDLPPVASAEHVEPDRFSGSWYEIARLPAAGEKPGIREAVTSCLTTFAPIAGRRCFSVVRQCRLPDGRIRTLRGEAYLVDGGGNARLRMSLLPPLRRCLPGVWHDYWILMIDDDYQYALAGSPDRRNLWLLSRTPYLSTSVEGRLVDHARRQHFRTDELLRVLP